MSQFDFSIEGLDGLRRAVARNPQKVLTEVAKFLQRGIAVYNRLILRNPWRMGQQGGGAPVDTGNLRDTHVREVNSWQARIYPTAPYAAYVHGIEGWPRRRNYQLRPWMDHAKDQGQRDIERLEGELLTNIVSDLAR